MKKKRKSADFCCPEFVPPGIADDFCSPENCCPKQLETQKFPSPSSCLPEEALQDLEEKIEAANVLLLNLALSNERPAEGRAESFEGLINQWVEVFITYKDKEAAQSKINDKTLFNDSYTTSGSSEKKKRKRKKRSNRRKLVYNKRMKARNVRTPLKSSKLVIKKKKVQKRKSLTGRVHIVGRDFVLLRKRELEIIIPFSKVASIKLRSRFVQPVNEPELIDIDPCLRRSLTFNFGETVASSPELLHIFFKMTLSIFFLDLLDKKVKIKLLDNVVQGTVEEVTKDSLLLCMPNKKKLTIPFESIYIIVI
ncbi:hypothetical protein [Domibacillus epiphyticus]|uniref:Uncharacterized protein n=1 Tax=Domibacillus epiphyticus TaxID=1714355 RepID=A0A1V2A6P8_9BACI|nr:hypothetical protein [Domibacillus epiphyticus]OMP66681.1 hypothetical protein BTO28_11615 [Domibacillus epiphyticus]